MELSDEQREERRQRAIELHKRLGPDGRPVFGGNQGGGRPRQPRIADMVMEKLRPQADAVAAAIIDSLQPGTPPHIRLQAARDAIALEAAEDKRQEREDEALERAKHAELIALTAAALAQLEGAGAINSLANMLTQGEVVEGSATDLDEAA